MEHDICLNIHYSAPKEIWDKIGEVYRSMDYWCGCENGGCPSWKGENIDLCASVEPSGIQICGKMPEEIWNTWYAELESKLSEKLGYAIGEPEDGYKFKYWAPFVKKYADIKNVDSEKIVFSDYSTFYWADFEVHERNIGAAPPYFYFSSPLIELRIIFESSGLFARKKLHDDFHVFQFKLDSLGVHTLDLT